MKPHRVNLSIFLFFALTSVSAFGKALPESAKKMSDREYENYLHGIYLKHYRDPVPYEVWSSLVNALSERSHKLKYKDNLWDLSASYFQNSSLWPKLWVANEHIANPHRIREGDSINFDLKTLIAVNWQGHSVDIQEQFPNIEIPPPIHQRDVLSQWEIPSSLPDIKEKVDPPPPDEGFDLQLVPMDKTALLPFYLSGEDLSGRGVVESKDGYGLSAFNGDDIIISYDGEMEMEGLYTIFENKGPPVSSFLSVFGANFKGYEIAVKGSVEIIGYVKGMDGMYRARVVESLAPIKPGDRVMAGAIPEYVLSQKGAQGSVSGMIIGSPHKGQGHFGMYSLVYLDKGLSDGIQVGDIYHVRLNKVDDIHYPYLHDRPSIGQIRVVHANPDTSTAIVIRLRDTIKVGDFFEPTSEVDSMEDSEEHEEIIIDEETVEPMEEGMLEDDGMEELDAVDEEPKDDGTERPKSDITPDEFDDSELNKLDPGDSDEFGDAELNAPDPKADQPDEFDDAELNQPDEENEELENEKREDFGKEEPSPVPEEVREEFEELRDM